MELSEQNAVQYLRDAGRASAEGEILVPAPFRARERQPRAEDLRHRRRREDRHRSPHRRPEKLGKPDTRPVRATASYSSSRACRGRPGPGPLSARNVPAWNCWPSCFPPVPSPNSLWFDETRGVLAMSCPPPEAVSGSSSFAPAWCRWTRRRYAGMLLAMIHSSTRKDPAVKERFGDPRLLVQQGVEPMIRAAAVAPSGPGQEPAGCRLPPAFAPVPDPRRLPSGEYPAGARRRPTRTAGQRPRAANWPM